MVFTTILNLNFARFLNIGITTALVNCSRTKSKIGLKMQTVMWIAGLRGAMAYALALKAANELPVPVGQIILIDTLIYAFITVIGIGSFLNPLLSKLDVKRKETSEFEDEQSEDENHKSCCSGFKNRVRRFDNEYFSPLFIK